MLTHVDTGEARAGLDRWNALPAALQPTVRPTGRSGHRVDLSVVEVHICERYATRQQLEERLEVLHGVRDPRRNAAVAMARVHPLPATVGERAKLPKVEVAAAARRYPKCRRRPRAYTMPVLGGRAHVRRLEDATRELRA